MTARRASSGAWARVEPRPGARGTRYRAYWYLEGRKQSSPTYPSSGDAGYVADWVNAEGGQVRTGDPRMLSGEVFEGTPAERAPELPAASEEPALPVTLGYWLTRWVDSRVNSGDVKRGTLDGYRRSLNLLTPWHELDLREWSDGQDGSMPTYTLIRDELLATYAPGYVSNALYRIGSARKMALAAGLPITVVRRARAKGKARVKDSAGIALTFDEAALLLEHVTHDETRDYLAVMLDIGCRPAEGRSITAASLHYTRDDMGGRVDVIDTKTRDGEVRTVHVSAGTWAILQARAAVTPHGPLFALDESNYRRNLYRARLELPAAKRGCRLHDMRHTCGSLMLELGYPVPAVAARLGITVTRLLKTYTHAFDRSGQDMAERFGDELQTARAERARGRFGLVG